MIIIILLARIKRLELLMIDLKSTVLPLNYILIIYLYYIISINILNI